QYPPSGKLGGNIAKKMHLTATLFAQAIARKPHELDLGVRPGAIQRPREVGDKRRRSLEQPDEDKIARCSLRDLGGQRLDPSGDFRLANNKDMYALHLQLPTARWRCHITIRADSPAPLSWPWRGRSSRKPCSASPNATASRCLIHRSRRCAPPTGSAGCRIFSISITRAW